MTNYIKLIIVSLFFNYSSFAQLYKSHDWEKTPTIFEISEEDKKLASVAIKEKTLIQYYRAGLGKSYKLYETKHSIIQVNSEKGVKRHNRVYIPTRNVLKVIDIKARVIAEDGSIKLLNKKNIKELKNVKNYGNFKIFALEGVTKNSQLEFIYTLEKRISGVGTIVVQKEYKVKESEVIIRNPSSLELEIKSYNNFPEFEEQKTEENKYESTAIATEIKAMTKERSATPNANKMKVAYMVKSQYNIDMWEDLEDNILNKFTKINPRKVKKIISDFENYKTKNENTEIINTICNYVNSTFNIVRNNDPIYDQISTIIYKKQASNQGIIKVYTSLLNHYKILYQIVLTSNRYNHKFDQYFYSNFNLQQTLIYFPEIGKYIQPDNVNTQLDYAPHQYISNKGFFISLDKFSEFKTIKVPESDHTVTDRKIVVSIDDQNTAIVKTSQKLTGYKAHNQREAYKYFLKKDLNEFKNIFAISGFEDAEIITFNIENEDFDHVTKNTPFMMDWSYTAESLTEEVGNDLLLNIGKVIGTQNEFYQEVARVNPVEIEYPNKYNYIFEILIPKGFEPEGLESLNIDKKLVIDGKEICLFKSNFEIIENKIIIRAQEDYNKLKIAIEYYEDYKDVVNSAFDFSKKSILFQKI